MSSDAFPQFLSGAIVMADLVAALFFLKFWHSSRDRLFLYFAGAFLILAAQRTLLTFATLDETLELMSYGLRAFAFILLIIGIADKNRATS